MVAGCVSASDVVPSPSWTAAMPGLCLTSIVAELGEWRDCERSACPPSLPPSKRRPTRSPTVEKCGATTTIAGLVPSLTVTVRVTEVAPPALSVAV